MKFLHSIQLLRFLAATMVMLAHVGIGVHSYKGIDMLFTISGFVIYLTSYQKIGKGCKKGISFLKKRCVRVFTFYWMLFGGLLLAGVYTLAVNWNFFKVLFLLPGHKSFLLITWSLSYELYFYGIIASLIVLTKLKQARMVLVLLWAITFVFLLLQWTDWSIKRSPLNFLLGQNIWQILNGTMAAMVFIKLKESKRFYSNILNYSLLGIGGGLFIAYVEYYSTLSFLLTGLGSALIVFAIVDLENRKNWNLPSPMIWLGNASYVAYLIHIPIFHGLKQYIDSQFYPQLLTILAVWILSVILHQWVEKPLVAKLNKLG